MKKAQIDAIRGQLKSLLAEIEEYEKLRSGRVSSIELDSLADLPDGLIRARIAAGLTQKDLAGRLGMREQQIQRYEASRYEGVSFARVVDVADAIGLKIRKRLEVLDTASPEAVMKRLRSVGLGADFIRRRISPDLNPGEGGALEIVNRVGAIFGWSPEALLGSGVIDPIQFGGTTARFKMPKGRDARSATVYTAYAYRLATICARAMASKPRKIIPIDWQLFRNRILSEYKVVDFEAVLAVAWDMGVVVLPLNDPGAFHGACWRIGGVNVVVLKQSLRYPARWTFDLLHELRHAGDEPEALEFEVIESAETSDERRNSKDEQQASWFAGQVALGGKAEELVKECLVLAESDLKRLKAAVQTIATRRGVSAGQLANYMAFRLSLQGEKWWGVASNLQDKSYDPMTRARDVFFSRFSFKDLDQSDADLLSLALHEETVDE
ncbi:MAG TPA: XRE family transcriptional regulator [Bradyrhizobium sp.]|nr:XRE family transcriptional regulator [Bradyrhizobium sp.]